MIPIQLVIMQSTFLNPGKFKCDVGEVSTKPGSPQYIMVLECYGDQCLLLGRGFSPFVFPVQVLGLDGESVNMISYGHSLFHGEIVRIGLYLS